VSDVGPTGLRVRQIERQGYEVITALSGAGKQVKILLFSAYVDLPEEALKWADRRVVRGVSPTSFLQDLQQLLAS
jgi:hypothetical protein